MKRLEIGLLYLCCHNALKNRYGINRVVHRKELISQLGRLFLIPRNMGDIILLELEDFGILKRLSKDEIVILEIDLDIKRDSNKIAQVFNLF